MLPDKKHCMETKELNCFCWDALLQCWYDLSSWAVSQRKGPSSCKMDSTPYTWYMQPVRKFTSSTKSTSQAQQWEEWEPTGCVPSRSLFNLLPPHLLTCFHPVFLPDQLPSQIWTQRLQGLTRRGRAAPRSRTKTREWSLQLRKRRTGDWILPQNLTPSLDHLGHLHHPLPGWRGRKVKENFMLVVCVEFTW